MIGIGRKYGRSWNAWAFLLPLQDFQTIFENGKALWTFEHAGDWQTIKRDGLYMKRRNARSKRNPTARIFAAKGYVNVHMFIATSVSFLTSLRRYDLSLKTAKGTKVEV